MKNLCIGFIGAGNMASSLINGLLSQGMEPGLILASDIDSSKTEHLRRENGIRIASNQELVNAADIIVLAVKPQVLGELCQKIDL
ncbi:MAG: pyrroline-5-carboxylate reductase family protein, partial [Pseudohongiellaceae bacterium]